MLPLGLLNAAQGHPMLVELKNGETLNGHLVNCDTWMNLTLKEVVQTSPDGDKFFRLPEIKYLRVPDEIIDLVKDQQQNQSSSRGRGSGAPRADHGGRGDRGRGGSRGGVGRGRGRGRG
ncbi:RNA processing protein [Pseudocyphellaria aurata]|nr:RNA processing protein [Pseudocyphellaria aurata]